MLDKEGEFDAIAVAAVEGVTPGQLTEQIRTDAAAPTPTSARARNRLKRPPARRRRFTKIIRYFLLSFAGIALFVGAFVIFNTLSITVAQRTREFATLRTIGASRRQVLSSVII